MDKRLALFLFLAFLIVAANGLLRSPPQKAAQKDEQRQVDPNHRQPLPDKEVGDKEGDDKQIGKPRPAAVPVVKEADEDISPQRVSLGSYDPTSGYRLLVTANSVGASIERIELNNPRYRELEDRSGYIGHLAPGDAPGGGCVLQIIGRQAPADLAGLKAQDIVKKFGKTIIASAADFEAALKQTEAGQRVSLVVQRQDQELTIEVPLARRPLEIIRPEFDTKQVNVAGKKHDPLSLLVSLVQVGDQKLDSEDDQDFLGVDLRKATWETAEATEDLVVFRRRLPKLGVEISKRYRLAKGPAGDPSPNAPEYHLMLEIDIRNLAEEPREVAYRLGGPTGLPLEGIWYAMNTKISRTWGSAGMRDVISHFNGIEPFQSSCTDIADDKVKPRSEDANLLDFIAVDTQYFAAALLPKKPNPKDIWFDVIQPIRVGAIPADKADKKLTNVSFYLKTKAFKIAPGDILHHEYQLFAGPKQPALLEHYANGQAKLEELVYYGWFGWVAKPMLWLLHTFYTFVRNYGLAIILLTVLVRGCMFPLGRKQAKSAQKMQELRPEMQRITEKYKTPEQRTRAQQELFRKHNYNPFGGCLLAFVQLPVFVGLYRSLAVDVELRQAPLFSDAIRWCSNLAAPDMLWDWSHLMPGFVNSYLGPFLNIFPLITIGLFIWQQKMFMPPPADEQAAMQQKMMSYMMIFIGVMFYKVASGLCVYFIASSLWGIAERKALPQSTTPGGR